ncbi:uncharacterized protein LOC111384708 [Olea europaea var. sylvestris]|uniref:uncharacterized protein LOC111384708 n=1 Tax=Olea europaea var. sylvestris TaxID=158386 RepID=UPI000C1D0340|nr:uncharacterized protein LOC111384708 [Olea europaea var. sylvestris]
MSHKFEALEKFKEFQTEVEKQLGKSIKALRSDQGDEYLSQEFKVYLSDNGILSQLSVPRTPQQNGYPKGMKCYYFYNPLDKKVFVSTNATFLEDKYIEEHKSTTKILLEEMLEHGSNNSVPNFRIESNSDDLEPPTEPTVADKVSKPMMPTRRTRGQDQAVGREDGPLVRLDNKAPSTITRSGRVVRPPSRYLLYEESYQAIFIEQEKDPTSFEEAMEDVDFE